jgi:hypothetical protein
MRLDVRGRRGFVSRLELRSDEMWLEELRGSETRRLLSSCSLVGPPGFRARDGRSGGGRGLCGWRRRS